MKHLKPNTKILILISLALSALLTSLTFPDNAAKENVTQTFVAGYGDQSSSFAPSTTSNNVTAENTTIVKCEFGKGFPKNESNYSRFQVEIEQMRRRARLKEGCESEEVSSKPKELERKHFLVDRNRQILYCWIHKVASTSWISVMSRLRGLRVKAKKIYREIGRLAAKSPDEVLIAARDYRIRFVVVRHPFRRLISAYRDRILAATQKYSAQAWTHVPRILRLTRPSLFLSKSSLSVMQIHGRTLGVVPTFEEFVRYLIHVANADHPKDGIHLNATEESTATFDVHWAPYHQHCSVCHIPYNFIIKLETIENDKKYMMEELCQDKGAEINKGQIRKGINSSTPANIVETPGFSRSQDLHYTTQKYGGSLNITEQKEDIQLPHVIESAHCFSDQKENSSSATENYTLRSINLEHYQVSNVGPYCSCYYFSQLTRDQMRSLKNIYAKDFKFFGYSTDEFESCLDKMF